MHGSLHAELYQPFCLEIENIEIWDITEEEHEATISKVDAQLQEAKHEIYVK